MNRAMVRRTLINNITVIWPTTIKPSSTTTLSASVLALATCSTVYVIREIIRPDGSRPKCAAGNFRYLPNTSSRSVITTLRPIRAIP